MINKIKKIFYSVLLVLTAQLNLNAQSYTVEHILDGGFERDPAIIKTCTNNGTGSNFGGFSGWFLDDDLQSITHNATPDVHDRRCVVEQTNSPLRNELATSRTSGNRILGFYTRSEPFRTDLINTTGLAVNTYQNSFRLSFLFRLANETSNYNNNQYLLKTQVKIIFIDNLNGNSSSIRIFDVYPTTQWQNFSIILNGIAYTDEIKVETYSYSNNIALKTNEALNGTNGIYLAFDDISLKGNCNNYLKYNAINDNDDNKLSDINTASNITWEPSTEPNLSFGNQFVIDRNLTLQNYTGTNAIKMGKDAKITVKNGSTLTILGSTLQAACGEMWDGIVVEPGGTLIMNNSTIMDAKVAVFADGTGQTNKPLITLKSNSILVPINGNLVPIQTFNVFDGNHKQLDLKDIHPNSEFRFNNFKHDLALKTNNIPNAATTRTGAELVNSTLSIALKRNIFSKGNEGIIARGCSLSLDSNTFTDQTKTGIYSYGDKSVNKKIWIRFNTFNYVGRNRTNNTQLDPNASGIRFEDGQNIEIINNTFDKQGAYGITCWKFDVNTNSPNFSIQIRNNKMYAWQWSAISLYGVKNAITFITTNSFFGQNALAYNWGGTYQPSFTMVLENSDNLAIQDNTFTEVYQGIYLAKCLSSEIENNTVNFNNVLSTIAAWNKKTGIYVASNNSTAINSPVEIKRNTVTSNVSYTINKNQNVSGIVLVDALISGEETLPTQTGGLIQGNTISNIGNGIVFSGNNIGLTPFGTSLLYHGNTFTNLIVGFNLNKAVLRLNCETIGSPQEAGNVFYNPTFTSVTNKWEYYDDFASTGTTYTNFIQHLKQNLWYINSFGNANIKYYNSITNPSPPLTPSTDFSNYSILLNRSGGNTINGICSNVQRNGNPNLVSATNDIVKWKKRWADLQTNQADSIPNNRQDRFMNRLDGVIKAIERKHYPIALNRLQRLNPDTSLVYEVNFKEFYTLVVTKALQNSSYTQEELNYIFQLANSHNQEAGLVVHDAREVYKKQTGMLIIEPLYMADQTTTNSSNRKADETNTSVFINSAALQNPIQVYPNPFSAAITITGLSEKATLILYDVLAKEVKRTEIENEVNLSELPKGLYFYKIENQKLEVVKTGKLIKE